jgi:arginase
VAPGVGTPVADGFSLEEATFILNEIRLFGKLVSCEFVEVNPLFDDQNTTAEVAVALIQELL